MNIVTITQAWHSGRRRPIRFCKRIGGVPKWTKELAIPQPYTQYFASATIFWRFMTTYVVNYIIRCSLHTFTLGCRQSNEHIPKVYYFEAVWLRTSCLSFNFSFSRKRNKTEDMCHGKTIKLCIENWRFV